MNTLSLRSRSSGRVVFGRLLLALVCAPAAIELHAAERRPTADEAEAIAVVKAELGRRAAEDRFSGAVLVARNGQPLYAEGFGLADRERKIPNTADTKLHLGSLGKMFTGVAVMQLVQSGKLAVADTVGKHLPDYPNKEIAAVTLHQLLTHTGGTGNIFGPAFWAQRDRLNELQDYIDLYGERGPRFEPGSQWDYSNYGFLLLGRIVEVVSGKRYHDYVREHIFEPAGMTDTNNAPKIEPVPGLAVGYTRGGGTRLAAAEPPSESAPPPAKKKGKGPGKMKRPKAETAGEASGPLQPTRPDRGTSAGGGYTTVKDLLRFATALVSHRLLDPVHTALVTTGKVDAEGRGKYAYGFIDQMTTEGARVIGHTGGGPGINAVLHVFPDSGYVVVALANLDGRTAGEAARFIEERLPLK